MEEEAEALWVSPIFQRLALQPCGIMSAVSGGWGGLIKPSLCRREPHVHVNFRAEQGGEERKHTEGIYVLLYR